MSQCFIIGVFLALSSCWWTMDWIDSEFKCI